MRGAPWLVAGLLLGGLLVGCLTPDDGSDDDETEMARTVWFGPVPGPEEAVEQINRLGRFPGVHVEEIGASVEGRPIHTVTVGDGPFVLWVMGRLHGNEPTGMQAILLVMELLAAEDVALPADAPAILHDLLRHRDLLKERLTFVFVPVGNPDGAAAYTRGNVNGIDLNRDFFAFTQMETQVIRDAFWQHLPDGCLDLHNIGPSENDFEAYGPTGPLLEPETEDLMLRDSWFAVHEVDAQGGRASGMNEDYRAPPPADDHPWPEVYHPGTHDFFCSARGAPGWTPEGSIPAGGNGATDPEFAWSARLHAVTVAASAFHWAGVYDGFVPLVAKDSAEDTSLSFTLEIDPAAASAARVQAAWRPSVTLADHSLLPVRVIVTDPTGTVHEETVTAPYQWSATFLVAAGGGTYQLSVEPVVPLTSILAGARVYAHTEPVPLATVTRETGGLRVEADADAPGDVEVWVTDVARAGAWQDASFDVMPAAVHNLSGSVHDRDVAAWRLILAPGQEVFLGVAGRADDEPGPFRFTAQSGEHVQMGVATKPRVAQS